MSRPARTPKLLAATWIGVLLAFTTPPLRAQEPGLTLPQVLERAREANPTLRAARARAAAVGARESEASTLPDPVLQLGAMNLSLPDLSADMAASMAPSVQLMQKVPFPGKLGLRGVIAAFDTGIGDTQADEAWWRIRTRAAGLFFDLYADERKAEVLRNTLRLLTDLEDVARAMYEAGTGRQADVLRASVEIARIDGEIRRVEAMREVTAARLNAVLDRPADTPVPRVVLPGLPDSVPPRDTLEAWADVGRPTLEGAKLAVKQAGARIELARKDLWPDLSLGFQYGQRDRGAGIERMGGIMVGVSLPVWAGRRQLRHRDEARAAALSSRARFDAVRADVHAEIGVQLAELQRARRLIDLHRNEILPEARANVESALSSYRVGSVDFGTLVDAELLVNQHEAELYGLTADYGKAVSGLEGAVGRPLPVNEPLISEAP